jgi:hypothetical protein
MGNELSDELKVMYLKALWKNNKHEIAKRRIKRFIYLPRLPSPRSGPEPVQYQEIYIEICNWHESGLIVVRGRMPDDTEWRNLEVLVGK